MANLVQFFKNNKALSVFVLMVVGMGSAFAAGVGTSAIGDIWTEIIGYAEGDLGAISTALVVIFAGVQIYNQNYIQAMSAVLFAIIFANLGNIVTAFFTATLPAAQTLL